MASERTISVKLRADILGFKRAMQDARSEADKTAARFDRAGNGIITTGGRMVRSAEVNREAWSTAGTALTSFGAIGVAAFGLSAKAAIDWETAFAGVLKTVDGTSEQMAVLEDGLLGLTRILPASSTEIADTAALLGQLGVQADAIVPLTKVMIDLGEATNLTAEEAATTLARMANIMGSTTDEVARMGATIVDLGNNSATTEREITDLALRLAAAGKQAGLSEANVFAFASALTSVGVEAEAGGTAMSKVITAIADAARTGNSDLATFAQVAGVTGDAFVQAFERDASSAVALFVEGLGEMSNAGESTTEIFNDLGLTDQRLMRAVLSLGSAQGLLTDQVRLANGAFEDNTALVDEANKRYETTEARVAIAQNAINEAAITLGDTFLPIIADVADGVAGLAVGFASLPEPVSGAIAGIGGVASVAALAAGGFLLLFPRVIETYKAFKTLNTVAPGMSGKLTGIGKAAGVAAVAFIALEGAAALVPDGVTGVTSSVSEATAALLRLGEVSGSVDSLFAFSDDAFGLTGNVNSLADAARRISDPTLTNRLADFGEGIRGFLHINAGTSSRELSVTQIGALGQSLASLVQSGYADEASSQFWQLAQAWQDGGGTVSELRDLMPDYTDALADASNESILTAEATDSLEMSTSDYNDALQESIDLTREASDARRDEWDTLTDYAATLDAVNDSIAENGATLDVNTESGRANRDALSSLASQTWAWVDSGIAAGEQTDELVSRMEEGREAFIAAAEQMGATTEEAEALATELGLIPTDIETAVSVTGSAAVVSAAEQVANALWNIPTAVGTTITVRQVSEDAYRTGAGAVYRAGGGPVYGQGTTTSDSIPAMLSNEEYVQNAAAHNFWGTPVMDALNARDVDAVWALLGARGFATGGAAASSTPAVYVNSSIGDVVAKLPAGEMGQFAREIAQSMLDLSSNVTGEALAAQNRNRAGASSLPGRLNT